MKYLKKYKTFELNDETYLSAADKLQKNHPERSKNLRKWVDDKQTSDIDYIDPRPLNAMDNVYYITKVLVQDYHTSDDDKNIIVDLKSVNDIYSLSILNFNGERVTFGIGTSIGMQYSINTYGSPWGPPGYSKRKDDPSLDMMGNVFPTEFYFDDRKSARIFMDIVERESGQKLLCSVNDMYKS